MKVELIHIYIYNKSSFLTKATSHCVCADLIKKTSLNLLFYLFKKQPKSLSFIYG